MVLLSQRCQALLFFKAFFLQLVDLFFVIFFDTKEFIFVFLDLPILFDLIFSIFGFKKLLVLIYLFFEVSPLLGPFVTISLIFN